MAFEASTANNPSIHYYTIKNLCANKENCYDKRKIKRGEVFTFFREANRDK